jgi:hypothetical protein
MPRGVIYYTYYENYVKELGSSPAVIRVSSTSIGGTLARFKSGGADSNCPRVRIRDLVSDFGAVGQRRSRSVSRNLA